MTLFLVYSGIRNYFYTRFGAGNTPAKTPHLPGVCRYFRALQEWCVTTGNQTRIFSKYAEKHWMIPSYSPADALRAAGVGKVDTAATFVWDVERHEKLKTFKLPASIGSIRFSKGTSLAFARAAEINLWDVDMPLRNISQLNRWQRVRVNIVQDLCNAQ